MHVGRDTRHLYRNAVMQYRVRQCNYRFRSPDPSHARLNDSKTSSIRYVCSIMQERNDITFKITSISMLCTFLAMVQSYRHQSFPFSLPHACSIILIHSSFPPCSYWIPAFLLKALMRPLVEESCLELSPGPSNSAWIFFANCLPSSTPHWSKELMFQIAPSVKVMCS